MADTKWNSLGLCAGVGLLDVAVQLGCEHLGIDCRPAALCEWDAYAAGVLLSRMEETSLEPCPIWCGDLRDFDARPFRGVVDVLAAGLPCQPYSVAGKQLGNSDHRSHGDDGSGPIPQFLRIVAECRPAVVFCENVPPWVRGGWFRPVGEELSRLGYEIEDPLFVTAEAVGASHKRERVFVLAHCSMRGRGELRQSSGSDGLADGCDEVLEQSHGSGRQIDEQGRGSNRRAASGRPGEAMAEADEQGPQERIGERGDEREEFAAVERSSSIFAPGPGADWRGIDAHLWPAIESGVCVLADGCSLVVDASRADQLRCAGNAVVPLQAAVAFVELMRRAMKEIP